MNDQLMNMLMGQVQQLNGLMMDVKGEMGSVSKDFENVKKDVERLNEGHNEQESAIHQVKSKLTKIEAQMDIFMKMVEELRLVNNLPKGSGISLTVNSETKIDGDVTGNVDTGDTYKKEYR